MNARSWITIRAAALPLMAALLLILSWPGGAGAEKDDSGWLGVSLQQLTPSLREAMDISSDAGVLVTKVVEDSPAEKAGLKMGDVILNFDGQAVSSPRQLSKLVRGTEPDTEVDIRVLRKGQEKTYRVKLGKSEPGKFLQLRVGDDKDKQSILMDMDKDDLLLGLSPLEGLSLTQGVWLGIKPVGLTEQLGEYFHVKDGSGVLIAEVFEDSPAEKAGLQAGDVIVKLNGERVEDTMELREEVGEHEEGDQVTVAVIRDGKEKSFQATLEESDMSKQLAVTKKLEKCLPGCKSMQILAPSDDMVDFYLQKQLDEDDLEALQERLDKLEKKLEKMQEKLEER